MTPKQIAHNVAADWIMGPINMGDLEDRIAAALQSFGDARATAERERCAEAANKTSILNRKKEFLTAHETRAAIVERIRALDT